MTGDHQDEDDDTPERLRLDWLYESFADPDSTGWSCPTCGFLNYHTLTELECGRCGFELDHDRVRDAGRGAAAMASRIYQMSDSELEYLAVCEARGRSPALNDDMLALERVGLIVLTRAGWGHYDVRLTQAGNTRIREIEQSRCDTCGGSGQLDECLGGIPTSGLVTCPDCSDG